MKATRKTYESGIAALITNCLVIHRRLLEFRFGQIRALELRKSARICQRANLALYI